MKKEIRMSLIDLYIGYACGAFLLYAVGGVAYALGKTKANVEIANRVRDCLKENA